MLAKQYYYCVFARNTAKVAAFRLVTRTILLLLQSLINNNNNNNNNNNKNFKGILLLINMLNITVQMKYQHSFNL